MRTPTLKFILKTNEKFIKNWNELLLVGSLETNKFNQKQFGCVLRIEQAGKLACCVLGQDRLRDASVFMWQIVGGAKQSTPSLC